MKTTQRQDHSGRALGASTPHPAGRHQTSAYSVPARDLWAELLFAGERSMKVWFYQNFPRAGWQPAGDLEWRNGHWHAQGAGRVALQALRAGRLADEIGVLPEKDPERVVTALKDIYSGPPVKAAAPFNAF